MDHKKKLQGYIFSREAQGQFVPQRLQNMLIRDYVESKQCKFVLSATEYYMEDCYMMLDSLLGKLDDINGVVFFSMNFLPKDKEKRTSLFNQILEKGKELHFALENYCIKNAKDVEQLEEIIVIRHLTTNNEPMELFIET